MPSTTARTTDRIEKTVQLRAPKSRVWRALTNSTEFGEWFGVKLKSPFTVGAAVKGNITIKNYEHLQFEMVIERLDAEDHFAYSWHPYAIDPKVDYSKEPMTLCEFHLADAADGTMLTIIESGFDKLPAHRRLEAFPRNESGWKSQSENIRKYVEN
jgi:uncharacterized protein YndB with AHSA1/START domain